MNNISPATLFITIFIITILVTRIFLYIAPTPSPTIKGLRIHHYMYGIAIIPVSLAVGSLSLLAIGSALFIDELTFLLIGGKTHKDNYSKISILGTLSFSIVVFLFRNQLAMLIAR